MRDKPPTRFLTSSSVARQIERSESLVRVLVRDGRLRVAGITPTGTKLFALEDVAALKRELEEGEAP
jgi:hypothetical protein